MLIRFHSNTWIIRREIHKLRQERREKYINFGNHIMLNEYLICVCKRLSLFHCSTQGIANAVKSLVPS